MIVIYFNNKKSHDYYSHYITFIIDHRNSWMIGLEKSNFAHLYLPVVARDKERFHEISMRITSSCRLRLIEPVMDINNKKNK